MNGLKGEKGEPGPASVSLGVRVSVPRGAGGGAGTPGGADGPHIMTTLCWPLARAPHTCAHAPAGAPGTEAPAWLFWTGTASWVLRAPAPGGAASLGAQPDSRSSPASERGFMLPTWVSLPVSPQEGGLQTGACGPAPSRPPGALSDCSRAR